MSEVKSIILTGASRGIGLAVAKYLLAQKHNVFLVARTKGPMELLKKEFPDQVQYLDADLSDFEVGPKVISQAISAFSRIDGLIINHGTLAPIKRIADSTAEEWRTAYDINLFSAIAFIQPAILYLRKTHGRIIFTSSGAALNGYSTWGSYGSAKAAINHLATTLNNEEPDITSIAIRPGIVDTDMQAEIRKNKNIMDKHDAEKFGNLHTEGKLLRPEQPGNVIARLAIGAGKEFNGRFMSWNENALAEFQD